MSELAEGAYLSPPVQRATKLLRRIAEGDRVTNMSRTARELEISRTTLLRLLHTLEAERFIEPAGDAGWRIGAGLIGIAAHAFASGDLAEAAQPVLQRLAEQVGMSAHLGVLDGREVVYLVRRTPNASFVSNIRVGSRLPAHAANMGRIMLAHLPEAEVRALYAGVPMPASTAHTATTVGGLLARLVQDREAGLAWSDGHFEPGIASVAAAVRDATGRPVAAINVSGQAASFEANRARIGAAVAEAAAEISGRLGFILRKVA
ncbi:IclR family transcriptional regulator [Roseomonas sp. AR75]|jgi:DNA-binding IclR family transcriptional regulator|uniref:IclR family transcriptional regulator n=1 Tax=Roseomonas sp. AR75 TaxID=2562311 RepID=UPI0010C0B459|nr:IclR family transcriptional regulator [Roseomonas sp. AR75]